MKTIFSSVFAARIQGKPAPAGQKSRTTPACPKRLAGLLVAAALAALPATALADGMDGPSRYGPPPELPPESQADDTPRRDIHMGTVDHMRMGRDEHGDVIMEVRPRPKQEANQPQAGPMYIYPQVGLPGPMPMGGQQGGGGQPGMRATTGSGRGGPANSGGMGTGQRSGTTGQTAPTNRQTTTTTGQTSAQTPQTTTSPTSGQPEADTPGTGS